MGLLCLGKIELHPMFQRGCLNDFAQIFHLKMALAQFYLCRYA